MATVILLVCFFFLIEKHVVNLYGLIIQGLIRTFVWMARLKYLKLLSEIFRLHFISIWSTGNPRVKTLFAVNSVKGGVCKTRTGYLRMAEADGKMRMKKCGKTPKKSKKNKKRNTDGKNI